LKAGDQTELGENGVNLSGGQKARVTLARTVYQDADVILLDDPVSALDATVGKAVFNQVIRGVCKEKTTILATHAVDFFELADKIIVMDQGKQVGFGKLDELRENPFMKVILDEHQAQRKKTMDSAKLKERKEPIDITVLQKAVTMMQFERRSKSTMKQSQMAKVTQLGGKSKSAINQPVEKLEFKRPSTKVDDTLVMAKKTSNNPENLLKNLTPVDTD
jgi:ABC-type multidrug transport system ATPase subunit